MCVYLSTYIHTISNSNSTSNSSNSNSNSNNAQGIGYVPDVAKTSMRWKMPLKVKQCT